MITAVIDSIAERKPKVNSETGWAMNRVAQITTKASGIRSQKRMRISERRRFLRVTGISCQSLMGLASATFWCLESSAIITCCKMDASNARTKANTNAARTPASTPHAAMQAPPTIGPRILGTRLTNAKTETPRVRLFFGTIFESNSMVAGSEIADQEIKNIAPTNTAHHVGMKITQRYPSMERKLKNNSARLVPRRSLK